MTFNRGFLCEKCGPIPAAKKKSIAKIKYDICTNCDKKVTPWIRPIKERAGRCSECEGGAFTSAYIKRQLLRCCKGCGTVKNIDSGEIIRVGRGANERD